MRQIILKDSGLSELTPNVRTASTGRAGHQGVHVFERPTFRHQRGHSASGGGGGESVPGQLVRELCKVESDGEAMKCHRMIASGNHLSPESCRNNKARLASGNCPVHVEGTRLN